MPGGVEATGQFRAPAQLAAGKLKRSAAGRALEVVMVFFAGDLVASALPGYLDGNKPVVRKQGLDIAIHGGDADAGDPFLRVPERFFRRKRPVRIHKGRSYRFFLTRIAELNRHGARSVYPSGETYRKKARSERGPEGSGCPAAPVKPGHLHLF